MKSFFIIFTLMISLICCTDDISTAQDLDASLTKLVDKSGLVGFSAIILDNSEIKYQNSFGFADKEKNLRYDNDTRQPIASISKTIVGISLMKAIEQGHFTLETPINDILPFDIINPHQKDKQILVRHLATHTSGLLDVEKTYFGSHFVDKGENITNPLVLQMVSLGFQTNKDVTSLGVFLENYYKVGGSDYSEANFDTNPIGSTYYYSNIATSLAALLIETKVGMSYRAYTKKYVFDPIGMSRTTWGADLSMANNANLYWSKSEVLPKYENSSYPDGSLTTSDNDMAKYMLELMSGFNGTSSNKILTNESYKVFFGKQFADGKLPTNFNPKESNAGIFWVYFTNGRMGHTGGDIGVFSIMAFDPKTNKAFYIMSNTDVDNIEDNVALVKEIQEMISQIKSFESN
jgi:CubicO group peptidase (beta-lactamase class C family)